MTVVMSRFLCSHSHAECCRDGVRGVSARKRVVLALFRTRKRLYAVQLSVGAEAVTAPCQHLMAIRLMAHIPHDAVVGSAEHIVQRHGKLHHSQRRSEVSGVHGEFLHDVFTQLTAQLWQLVHAQLAQIDGISYLF